MAATSNNAEVGKFGDKLKEEVEKGKEKEPSRMGDIDKLEKQVGKFRVQLKEEVEKGKEKEHSMMGDIEKLDKQLGYIERGLKNLKNFQIDLTKPLNTIQTNINDICEGIKLLPSHDDSPVTRRRRREIQGNIGVLRSNITKLKIKIPLQHQPSISSSEAGRDFQKTVASTQFGELPSLCEGAKLKETKFFLEMKKIFEEELATKEEPKIEGVDSAMRMKLCFLCFAVFPEDAEIRRRLLHLWWIGEDLLPKEENPPNNSAEFADRALERFVELGLIEPVKEESRPEKASAKSFKMHPLKRAALIKLAEEANFFDFDEKGNLGNPLRSSSRSTRACLVKKTTEEEEEEKSTSKLKQTIEDLKQLKTVFNVSEQFPDLRIPKKSLLKMKHIGVVYYGRWESTAKRHIEVENGDFLEALSDKKKLRFLSLQGLSRITDIPSFGVNLKNLRILDLRACYNLERLPNDLDFLRKLAYLDISECYLLDFMPRNLALLPELKVLKGFVVSDKWKSCSLGELAAGLKKLVKLGIIINTDEFQVGDLEKELRNRKFKALEKLKIAWGARPLAKVNKEDEKRSKKEGKKRCQWWKRGGKSTSATSGSVTVANDGSRPDVHQKNHEATVEGSKLEDKGKEEDGKKHEITATSGSVTVANDGSRLDVHQKNHEATTEESKLEDKDEGEDGEKHEATATSGPVTVAGDKSHSDVHQENQEATREESELENKNKKEDDENHEATTTSEPATIAGDGSHSDVHQKNQEATTEESKLENKDKKEDGANYEATAASGSVTGAGDGSPGAHQKNNEATTEESKLENKDKKEDGENHKASSVSGPVNAVNDESPDANENNHEAITEKDKKEYGENHEAINDNKSIPKNIQNKGQNGSDRGLQKLDLESYPDSELPKWMGSEICENLKKLYIRGGNLKNLDSVLQAGKTWRVEILRLKYLNDLKMDWKQMQELFPKLRYLEKIKCPKITQCPCDGNGIWINPEEKKNSEPAN